MTRRALIIAVLLVAAIGGLFAMRQAVIAGTEAKFMVLHRNGTATPARFGASYRLFWIASGHRRLEASRVDAQPGCKDGLALLLYHGRGETISDWAKAQAFLARHCVSSIVFDYSGHGASTPPAHVATLDEDAVAAYREFVRQYPGRTRRCVLAHSMGNAPMLQAYPAFNPPPDCVVVANAFLSAQAIAEANGMPAPLALFLTGVWDNRAAIRDVHSPLLIVHSDADRTVPPEMSDTLAVAAPAGAINLTLHGFGHDALYEEASERWWAPVLRFLQRTKG